MKKRLAALIVGLFMTCGALAGCSGNSNKTTAPSTNTGGNQASTDSNASDAADTTTAETASGDNGEITPFVYVVPGDEPRELTQVLTVINEKMATDGAGVALELRYIPWDAWDQRVNIMLSTGEKFDMFHVMNDRVSITNYASRGALSDLTEYMEQYGENIKKVNPEMMMKSGQVNGVQYAIPTYWVESALHPEITLRGDLLKKYGIDKVPSSFEELTAAYEKVMAEWDGVQKPYVPLIGANSTNFEVAAKTYDTWPYHIYDKVFYVNQDGTIKNFFETEEFRKDSANARLWYQKGLINPDVLTFTPDQNSNQLNSGDWFVHFGTIGNIDTMKTNYPDITTDDFIWLDMDESKPKIRPYGTRNMNAVPLSSDHPEASVKFVNWLYANQENYDLFLYGREGVDYNKVEPHNREPIINLSINAELYSFADWMIGNVEYIRPGITAPAATNDALYTKNESAVPGIASMFTFDATDVQTQVADVQTQISAVITPIATGVVDYDANIDAALDMLKKAGVDELIAEFVKQYEASK